MATMTPTFRALLDSEAYPRAYLHKFVGKATPAFLSARDALVARWNGTLGPARASSGGAYISCSLTVNITSADDVGRLMEETLALPDLKVML